MGRGVLRSLGHGGALAVGGSHLCEDPVQPLEGSVEVHLYPAGGGSDLLAPVLLPPPQTSPRMTSTTDLFIF